MYLRDKNSGDNIEILDFAALIDPNLEQVSGRYHAGEEMQEPSKFSKTDLAFPSGEDLPVCWKNSQYRTN